MFEVGTEESMAALMAEINMAESVAAAKRDQIEAMNNAKSAFDSYWAGSASASVFHHVKRGAVRVVHA